MASEVEAAKNVLVVLKEAFELASKFSAVSNVLEIISPFIKVCPFVGAALGLVKCFLPDRKHEEILRCFENLSVKIGQVRDDIKELEKTTKWEAVKLQYGDAVGRIKFGMQLCLDIGKAKGEDSKMRYQERLKELCANQEFTLAVNSLLDGLAGSGVFRSSILDEFYGKTKGHRPMISALACRLLQLICGGIMVHATYEAAVRGKAGASDIMPEYGRSLEAVHAKVQSVLEACVTRFSDNMKTDLNSFLDKSLANKALVDELHHFMCDKYDWLEHFCLVYNDVSGFENHCFNGSRIDSLHHNGKCGIVFYRPAGEPPRFSHRYDEAYKIVDDVNCSNAREGFKNIEAALANRRIPWTGLVIVKRYVDLWFGGNFSARIVQIVGPNATAILMLQ